MSIQLVFLFPCYRFLIVFPPNHFLAVFDSYKSRFSLCLSRSHTWAHNSAVLLETFQSSTRWWTTAFYDWNTTLEGFQRRCLLYRGQTAVLSARRALNELILFITHGRAPPPFTQHTHHFKKITLLMASHNSRPTAGVLLTYWMLHFWHFWEAFELL